MLPALMLLAAVSSGPPAIAPGTYTYAASLGGQSVGTSTIDVKGGAATEIDEKAAGSMNGQSSTAATVLNLAADLSPTSYAGNYTVGGQPTKEQVTLTPTTATVGSQTFTLHGDTKHFVVIEPGLLSGIFALPAQMQAWNDAPVLAIVPAMSAGMPLAPEASATAARPAAVPANDAALAFGGQFAFTIWYDPATYVADEIDVPAQNLVVVRQRQ